MCHHNNCLSLFGCHVPPYACLSACVTFLCTQRNGEIFTFSLYSILSIDASLHQIKVASGPKLYFYVEIFFKSKSKAKAKKYSR